MPARIVHVALPPEQQAPRDPNFTFMTEADSVAKSLSLAPELGAVSEIAVQEVVPIVPNTRADGRSWNQIRFVMQMDLMNAENRMQMQQVEFDMNAGLLLDFVQQPGLINQPWRFNATKEQRPNSDVSFWMGVAKKD